MTDEILLRILIGVVSFACGMFYGRVIMGKWDTPDKN
jgi:hypothetical protein